MKKIVGLFAVIALVGASCKNNGNTSDAYGNFQATEVVVSSEASGRILEMNLTEGQQLDKGDLVVVVDSVQVSLKIMELEARKFAAVSKKPNIMAQVGVYAQQKEVLNKELKRFSKMEDDGAATQKQIDDIDGQIKILEKQLNAVKSNLLGVDAEISAIEAGIAQAEDLLERTKHKSPISGTVLQKYAEAGEVITQGRPLFKIANLNKMELKAYVSGNQLARLKIGEAVKVLTDGVNGIVENKGTISWISSEAEFTPKNIQTREERQSQMYAFKVLVNNDGEIKINMPGEVVFLDE